MTEVKSPEDTSGGGLVACRATVNLGDAHTRVRAGTVILVNPDIPYVSERLAAGYLIPLPQKDQPTAATSQDAA